MKITDKEFVYTNSADSSKPGYLKRKFERIRKSQAKIEELKEHFTKVTPIRKEGRK